MADETVLIVDDQENLADLYADILEPDYETTVAYDGEGALTTLDERVDVVLLDRRMPDLSGDEVLDRFRTDGYDCPVVMVSAVDPDVDLLGMRCNEYIVKPVEPDELHDVVERMLALSTADVQVKEYVSLVAKQATLQTELPQEALRDHGEYQDLLARIETLKERAGPAIRAFEENLADDDAS
jgi:DNA-binding response OmpR family regulator